MPIVGADWEITKRCNQTCSFCLNASGPNHEDTLDTDSCISIVDKLVSFGVFHIVITGGEPFLRPDIGVILQYAATRHLIWTITSNGSVLTPKLIDQLEPIRANFRSIQISLHSTNPDTYRAYGIDPQNITLVQENIRNLVVKGFITTVICLFNGENEDEVLSTYRWCADAGVYGFISSPIKPSGRAINIKGNFASPEHRWVALLRVLFADQRKIAGPRILISEPPLFQSYSNKRLSLELLKYSCPAATQTFMIKHDGAVFPCPFISPDCTNDPGTVRFCGGNMMSSSLDAIFSAPGFSSFKTNLTSATLTSGAVDNNCHGCGQFKKATCLPCQLGFSSCHQLVRATTDLASASINTSMSRPKQL